MLRLSIVAIPALIAVIILAGVVGVRSLVRSTAPPAPTLLPRSPSPISFPSADPLPDVALPTIRADSDKDGLPDDLERIYQTDANNPDTDGDGFPDGVEVANGYDPTKKAPGDKITIPAPPSPSAAPTFTEQFLARTGLPNDPKSLLKSDEVGNFIAESNVRGFLPTVTDADLTIVGAAGKDSIVRYLNAVSIPQNPRMALVDVSDVSKAFATLTQSNNDAPLRDVIGKFDRNLTELKKAPVPGEAVALHKQYVAATLALKENAERLLKYREDYVGALVAASRIENLRGVFQAVETGIRDLEKKYKIS
ncbi:MAG: thrombospondin type 3 repeat-containing protein [Parcubacteria group bacterium Gr01-1014_106]|nr:MAG: thrombospondin type 3 repeat-containing protein [Parcubacteria group bacterium Gr01-1014_106]